MRYEKPLVVRSVEAVSAVHGSDPPQKGTSGYDLYNTHEMTNPAYEADE